MTNVESTAKSAPRHPARKTVVHLRQSSLAQVKQNEPASTVVHTCMSVRGCRQPGSLRPGNSWGGGGAKGLKTGVAASARCAK